MPTPSLLTTWLIPRLLTGCGPQQEYALATPSSEPPTSEHLRFIKRYSDTMLELFAGEDSPYCYDWIEDKRERRAYVKSWWCRMTDPGNPIDQEYADECLADLERRIEAGYGAEVEGVDYDCALCKLEQTEKNQHSACHDDDPKPEAQDTGDTGDTGGYGSASSLLVLLLNR